MDLYIERSGTGEKVVFVHGAGGNSASWVFQKEYLHERAEVVLLDLPGRGRSGEQGLSSIADYAGIVRDVIFDNDLQGCYLAGHSMGGLIGMSLAIAHPEILKGLILVSTGARLRVSPEILEWIMVDKERAVNLIMDMAFSNKECAELAGRLGFRDDEGACRNDIRRFPCMRSGGFHGRNQRDRFADIDRLRPRRPSFTPEILYLSSQLHSGIGAADDPGCRSHSASGET